MTYIESQNIDIKYTALCYMAMANQIIVGFQLLLVKQMYKIYVLHIQHDNS